MKVNFYIGTRDNILLSISYNGKRLQTTIGLQCSKKNWNSNKQRVKSSASNSMDINKALDNVEHISKMVYYEFHSSNKIPCVKAFKNQIHLTLKGKENNELTFIEFFNDFISKSENNKAKSTIADYRYTLNSLKECSSIFKFDLTWDCFDMKFYDDYMSYQFSYKKNSDNLFGKRIKVLKTVLNKAVDYDYRPNSSYKKFKVLQRESDDIYLNDEEIKEIASLSFDRKDLEEVRDLFLIGCYTGLRYSDIQQLDRESVKENQLKVRCKKTNKFIATLLIEPTFDILCKYEFCLPNVHNTIFNRKIKEVGKLARIDSLQETENYIGIKRTVQKVPKYELISAHTSRRSFVTNLYKKGANVVGLMGITGHKKESTFLRYVKITKEESLKQISELLLK